ncbi:MAG: exosortase/archaeosortase family protein [Candidatus Diapherotrites archaeon]|nr:exosortase/archaeosortase family protein [Candidatus Diapherotrites archaeon]
MGTRKEKMHKGIAFMLRFFALYAVLQALLVVAPLSVLQNALAGFVGSVLSIPHAGPYLFLNGAVFEITNSCTGLVSGIILASVVFAFRKPDLKTKARLFLAGFFVLFPLNVVRVLGIVWVARETNPLWAEGLHIATWFLVSVLVLGLWYYLSTRFAGVKRLDELL